MNGSARREHRCGVESITIEPSVFLYFLGNSLQMFTIQNLILHRVCILEMRNSEEVCGQLATNESLKTQVQKVSTTYITANAVLEAVPGVLLALIIGRLSDQYGRKLPMLYNLTLGLLSAAFLALYSWESTWPVSYMLVAAALRGLSGYQPIFAMMSLSYISDVTDQQNRTFRLGVVEANMLVGLSLGLFCGGALLNITGYVAIFGWATICLALSLIYTAVRLKKQEVEYPDVADDGRGGICRHLHQTWQVLWKKPARWRLYIFILTIVVTGSAICVTGEVSVFYLYMQKKFGWSFSAFTEFATAALIARAIGCSAVLGLMTSCLQMSDSAIGAIGAILFMSALLVIALVQQSWVLAICVMIFQAGNASTAIVRTLASKLVPKHEIGQVFSVLTAVEAATPLASVPIFMMIYRSTLDSFPGTVFLIMAAIQLGLAFVFLWFRKEMKQKTHFDFERLDEQNGILRSQ